MVNIREKIRDYIYAGTTAPGVFLTEREIAERFQLKRGNTREMLLALEGEGSIRRVPLKGYCSVDYDNTDLQTVLALRYVIEREAIRQAVVRATREDMVRITLIFEDLERHLTENDLEGFGRADLEFHTALIAAAHDNLLLNFFTFLTGTLFRRFNTIHHKSEGAQAAHRALFDAFKSHDVKTAQAALKEHIARNQEK